MEEQEWPLSKTEFEQIYAKVPRLTVEIIVRNQNHAIYLTQRAAGPCEGLWHLPGGTVQFGEMLRNAVRRVASRELSIDVQEARDCGYIEYQSHYLRGLDYPVGLVFEIVEYNGSPMVNAEASRGAWFTKLPNRIHPDQDEFLINKHYLERPPE